ncbi:MAG TPA: hypothetical protein VIJ79_04860 [Acidobacteriaceae bacterium]
MNRPTQPPDSPEDNEPDTIATPEGDNEAPPDQPLAPSDVDLERPRGDEPHFTQPLRDALD